jgi:hypothetical protein
MSSNRRVLLHLFVLVLALLPSGAARAQARYPTPEAAADALVTAIRGQDEAALRTVLGKDFRNVLPTGHLTRQDRASFLTAWDDHHEVRKEPDGRVTVMAGREGWTLPLPLVQEVGGWRFDVRAGADEMDRRRIGRNEMAAIQAMLAYHDAQKEYAVVDHDRDGVLEYARRIASSRGRHDGLYWPAGRGIPESPLGPLLANQRAGEPYYGYRFRILTGQGVHAPGGKYDYVVDGQMTRGFALAAWPAEYGATGVMSFLINQDGEVYQRDLGPNGAAVLSRARAFDPAPGWTRAGRRQLP